MTEVGCDITDFYPRPLRGGRLLLGVPADRPKVFLSTPSARRATNDRTIGFSNCEFLSTPSARRATESKRQKADPQAISIHALCEEGDYRLPPKISIVYAFLSTPSARRATFSLILFQRSRPISIHALCEEGDHLLCHGLLPHLYFYPRPLRGGRPFAGLFIFAPKLFLSTPSARRATHLLL